MTAVVMEVCSPLFLGMVDSWRLVVGVRCGSGIPRMASCSGKTLPRAPRLYRCSFLLTESGWPPTDCEAFVFWRPVLGGCWAKFILRDRYWQEHMMAA